MRLRTLVPGVVFCLMVSARPASATLIDLGNGMIYDTVQDLTWLQDISYARTSGADADGNMTYDQAEAWAESLVFGGYDDWRLPRMRNLALGYYSNDEVTGVMAQLGAYWTQEEGVPYPIEYNWPDSMAPFTDMTAVWVAPPEGEQPCLPSLANCFVFLWWTTIDLSAYHWGRTEPGPGAWAVREGGNPYARVPEPSALMIGLCAAFGLRLLPRRANH